MIKRICTATTVLLLLGLAGCSSAPAAKDSSASSSSVPAEDLADTPEPQPTPEAIGGTLDGSWGAFGPDSVVVLHISGHRVELLGGGRCDKEAGIPTIRLTCNCAKAERTVGKVWGLSDKSMTVDWEGFGADSFRRSTPDTDG